MALNADLQILTQPGATGNQTYSLVANFDPKAIILWATPQTADGSIANYSFGVGFGTYRGSAVQQRYACFRGLDVSLTADTGSGQNSDAVLVLMTSSGGASSRDLEIDLVSMQGGATSEVVLNWVNLHTTASIRIFMLVLGGSEITDALVDDFAQGTGSTTQDETVVSGFGKPELVFFSAVGVTALADAAVSPAFSFGFAKQGETGRGYGFWQTDGNTSSLVWALQRPDYCIEALLAAGGLHSAGRLDPVAANWPTDGFRMLWDSNPTDARIFSYLALRTTAQITTGANTALTAGSTQDNACGFPPKLGLVFGWNFIANAGTPPNVLPTGTGADLAGFGIGAYDGTDEAWAGFTEDDALGTMDSNSQQSIAKVIRNYNAAAALQSEADASFSGNNFRLTWNDLDTVAREYQWLALGDAAGGAVASLVSDPFRQASNLYKR